MDFLGRTFCDTVYIVKIVAMLKLLIGDAYVLQ